MRIAIGAALVLGLSGCVQETYHLQGVGFGTYEEYLQAREAREAALAGSTQPIEETVLPPTDPDKTPEQVVVVELPSDPQPVAPVDPEEPVQLIVPRVGEPLDATVAAEVDNPGISDEQDFEAVSSRETIESDRERLAAQRQNYVQIEPTAVPKRNGGSNRPNIVSFALETTNNVGESLYRRSGLRTAAGSQRACAKFTSADLAQEAFLSAGGPKRDRKNLDFDGDGFACDWDPRPFRLAVQ